MNAELARASLHLHALELRDDIGVATLMRFGVCRNAILELSLPE